MIEQCGKKSFIDKQISSRRFPKHFSADSQVYMDLDLGGLKETNTFYENFPDDPTHKNFNNRERIFARINTEKSGTQYGVNSPIGTSCKK